MSDTQRATLIPVREVEAEMLAVGEKLHNVADALAADDDHHLADPHSGQGGNRVVDHRPVVDRQQVLVRDDGERKKTGRRSPRQHKALHCASNGIVSESVSGSIARLSLGRGVGPVHVNRSGSAPAMSWAWRSDWTTPIGLALVPERVSHSRTASRAGSRLRSR